MDQLNLDAIRSRTLLAADTDKHIFFGVDNKFIAHALITLMSLAEHAGASAFHFHLISSDLTDADAARFTAVLSGTRHGLTLHHAGSDLFVSLPTTQLFTRATYYRLLAPKLIPNAGKVLYLDADMVCISNPDALWSLPFDEEAIALVVAESDPLQARLAANVGLRGSAYFNAGMMLIDIARWNRAAISEQALAMLVAQGQRLQYLDQDALNTVLEGRVNYIDRRFNYIEMLAHDAQGYQRDVPADTCIIHYAGADKPWQTWNQQYVCRHYRAVYQRSPLSDHPLDRPTEAQQAKKMYKSLFRTRRLCRGVYWWIRYYQMRYL